MKKTLIIAALFTLSPCAFSQNTQDYFDKLNNAVFDLAHSDAELADSCKINAGTKNYTSDIQQNLSSLVKVTYFTGHLISQKTFCKLAEFDKWNDQLLQKNTNLCKALDKSGTDLYNWKIELLSAINTDNLNIVKGKNKNLYKYKAANCEISK